MLAPVVSYSKIKLLSAQLVYDHLLLTHVWTLIGSQRRWLYFYVLCFNCFSFDAEFDHDVPHVLCLYNTVYPCDSAGSSVEIFRSLELLSNIPGALYPVLTVLQEIRAIQTT